MTPEDVVYVSLGDPIILSCLAEGTPVPEILWYRDNDLVQTSASLAVANDGTELRISSIRQEDIGDYTCVAKNGQGSVRHTTKLVVAGKSIERKEKKITVCRAPVVICMSILAHHL